MTVSQIHFRSISLPSRLHPINSPDLESHLQNLKSWEVSKAVPISSDAIQSGLLELSELYTFVENLAQSTAPQQSLHQDEKSIQDSLSTSIELLDSCTTIRELVQMIRETIQALQSALRRKRLDSSIQADIASYLSIRKKMNRCITKNLKTLKKLENKNGPSLPLLEGEHFIGAFRQATSINISIFKAILIFLSWPTTSWNLVSKLMLVKPIRDHNVVSEMGCVDFAVNSLQGRGRNNESKFLDVQMMQRDLQNLDTCAEGIEARLDGLFRQLLKSRVTLLNIVTDH